VATFCTVFKERSFGAPRLAAGATPLDLARAREGVSCAAGNTGHQRPGSPGLAVVGGSFARPFGRWPLGRAADVHGGLATGRAAATTPVLRDTGRTRPARRADLSRLRRYVAEMSRIGIRSGTAGRTRHRAPR
jgi:hypothetical protein